MKNDNILKSRTKFYKKYAIDYNIISIKRSFQPVLFFSKSVLVFTYI